MRSVDKVISAELGFSPLDSKDFIKDIDQVLKIIEESGMEYHVGIMSTVVIGKAQEIFDLLESIYKGMDAVCSFTFHINISNGCLACSK